MMECNKKKSDSIDAYIFACIDRNRISSIYFLLQQKTRNQTHSDNPEEAANNNNFGLSSIAPCLNQLC